MDPDELKTWISAIFEKVPNMMVTLEQGDISVLGPSYLREKLVQCREFLNEINQDIVILKQEIWDATRELERQKTEYKIELDQLLANDEKVRRGTSYKDRVATANQILMDQLQAINISEEKKLDLEALDGILKLKLRELRDANADIRTAKQLMNTEISIGSFYGSEDGKKKSREEVSPETLLESVETSESSETKNENQLDLFEEIEEPVEESQPETKDEDYSEILDLL